MEVEQQRLVNRAMTYDEVSMESSKSFVKALQELKNLRPQLHSAAEYCEKSYLHNEQKQMVLDNLKDYAVRVLTNAVDHFGTVAYKLTDLLEQQTSDVSTMELKVSCMNQQLLTCQTYSNIEGLRRQQLLAFIPRHHKHYILPKSVNKKARLQLAGIPAAQTLSWHLASETKSTLKGSQQALLRTGDHKTSGVFHLLDNDENRWTKSSAIPAQVSSGCPASSGIAQKFGVARRDAMEGTKLWRHLDHLTTQDVRLHVPLFAAKVCYQLSLLNRKLLS